MSGIPSAAVVLLFISCLIASSIADYPWIVQSDIKPEDLPPNLTREASHQLLLEQLCKRNMGQLVFEMRSEFYTMATGKDFYRLIADENENKEYHAVSEASIILSQKLLDMELVNKALRAAMAAGASSVFREKDIAKGLPAIKETIEKFLQNSSTVFENYKRLKNEALAKPLPTDYKIYYYEVPKTLDDAKNIAAESLNDPFLKKLMVHSIFVNEARNATTPESGLLAKTVLKLGKDSEIGTKVQTLYDEAISEAASKIEDIDGTQVNEKHLKGNFIQTAKEFFTILANKFENDPATKTKFAETKAEISKS